MPRTRTSGPWPEPGGSADAVGAAMYALVADLFPICRSITGDGFRETLQRLGTLVPLEVHEVPTGTPVFDWTVPKEWNIRDAYVKNAAGERVIDFRRSNLHVVSFSVPLHARMTLAELRPHLHTLPDHPDWIPYRTSYYAESWGFCLPHRTLEALPEGEYEVSIDSTLAPGSLTYGEFVLPGEEPHEVLISCHSCHPSLANDNLSGMALAAALARDLMAREWRRYTYRFLFIPGTIGSITWLARNEAAASRVRHGLVLSCVGDAGPFTYKRSRRGNAVIDRAVEHVLRTSGAPFHVVDFVPYGYDERQYCSPGFDLAVGCFMRTPNGQYPEYHTSADNLELVAAEHLADSYRTLLEIVDVLEHDHRYRNTNPKCEPQLGRRGLYRATGGAELPGYEMALLWVLNQSDGTRSLLDVAERAQLPFAVVRRAAQDLVTAGLLRAGEAAQAGHGAAPVDGMEPAPVRKREERR
jgi:aminopeptidase-like protein